jgi:hypothetical protein
MRSIRQHLGEDIHRARELLVGHRSDPGRRDLENQRMPRVEGSESDFPPVACAVRLRLASEARDDSHLHNPHLEMSTSP